MLLVTIGIVVVLSAVALVFFCFGYNLGQEDADTIWEKHYPIDVARNRDLLADGRGVGKASK